MISRKKFLGQVGVVTAGLALKPIISNAYWKADSNNKTEERLNGPKAIGLPKSFRL
jgi:hypothetical protein